MAIDTENHNDKKEVLIKNPEIEIRGGLTPAQDLICEQLIKIVGKFNGKVVAKGVGASLVADARIAPRIWFVIPDRVKEDCMSAEINVIRGREVVVFTTCNVKRYNETIMTEPSMVQQKYFLPEEKIELTEETRRLNKTETNKEAGEGVSKIIAKFRREKEASDRWFEQLSEPQKEILRKIKILGKDENTNSESIIKKHRKILELLLNAAQTNEKKIILFAIKVNANTPTVLVIPEGQEKPPSENKDDVYTRKTETGTRFIFSFDPNPYGINAVKSQFGNDWVIEVKDQPS